MKPLILVLACLAPAAGALEAAPDPSFSLSASAADFDSYFPSYLANGYFSTMTAPRGTEGNLAYMVAFMDYGQGRQARPAAIPGLERDRLLDRRLGAGHFWMNQVPLIPALFEDYARP